MGLDILLRSSTRTLPPGMLLLSRLQGQLSYVAHGVFEALCTPSTVLSERLIHATSKKSNTLQCSAHPTSERQAWLYQDNSSYIKRNQPNNNQLICGVVYRN